MTDELTLSQRIRLGAALNGGVTLNLSREEAWALCRVLEREEAVADLERRAVAVMANYEAIDRLRHKVCRSIVDNVAALAVCAVFMAMFV